MSRRPARKPATPAAAQSATSHAPGLLATGVGAAAALVIIGFVEGARRIDDTPRFLHLAAGCAWLGMALGQRLPRGLMRRTLQHVEQRWLDKPQTPHSGKPKQAGRSASPLGQSIACTATAIVALAAGLACALLPALLAAAEAVLEGATAHFLWRDDMLPVLKGLLVAVAAVGPFAGVGLLIRSVHQLRGAQQPWDMTATASLLSGAAAACALLCLLGKSALHGSGLMWMGALLLLGAAMFAVSLPAPPTVREHKTPQRTVALPAVPAPGSPVLLAALIVGSMAAAVAARVWVDAGCALPGRSPLRGCAAASLILLALGTGVGGGIQRSSESLRRLGRMAALAGAALAAGAVAFNLALRGSTIPSGAGSAVLWIMAAAAPCLLLGEMLGGALAGCVARADLPASRGARCLRYMALAAGVCLAWAADFLVAVVGGYAALSVCALLLLAVGGAVLIGVSQDAAERRWLDAGAVIAAVVLFAAVLPSAGGGMLSAAPVRTTAVADAQHESTPGDPARSPSRILAQAARASTGN